MGNVGIVLIAFASWMKEIISHPNTPAYVQAIAVIIATLAGLNYLKKRATERKFDLIIKTYKYCLEACDGLISLKQAPAFFENRDAVEEFESINNKNLAEVVSHYAEFCLNSLDQKHELFDDLYNCYAEMQLFFNKEKRIIKPIEDLLWSRNRIKLLLEILKYSKKQMENLTDVGQNNVLKTVRNAMVQIWENIELTDWQKEYEKKEEEIDGMKGVRKFYYLNDLIKKARSDIDEIFPALIKRKALSR